MSNAIEAARVEIYKKMTPDLRKVADDMDTKLKTMYSKNVVTMYDLGKHLRAVNADEGTYGSECIKQLSDYHRLDPKFLYDIMSFSDVFEKDFVQTKTAQPLSNGGYLSLSHWIQFSKIKSDKPRGKLIEKTLRESLSAKDLETAIRSGTEGKSRNASSQGGRKPKKPTSPGAGLQKTCDIGTKFVRWEEVANETVFGVLSEIEPDKVNDVILQKAEATKELLENVAKTAETMVENLTPAIEHMRDVLAAKADAEASDAVEGYSEEEAPKKKKKLRAAKTEGDEPPAKAKKKKKKKKPVAAAVDSDDFGE